MMEILRPWAVAFEVATPDSSPEDPQSFDFVAEGTYRLAPAVELAVSLGEGRGWKGRFFGEARGLSLVVAGPGQTDLLVVANGVPYSLAVSEPTSYRVLPAWPVEALQVDPPSDTVLLFNFSDILAIGPQGTVRWEAEKVVSDGFTRIQMTDLEVIVEGYVAWERREVETALSLESGKVLRRG